MIYKTGATSNSIDVFVGDDTGLPVLGLVAATFPTITYSLAGPNADVAFPALSDLAAITTAYASGGVKERGNGYYRLDVPDAAFATGGVVTIRSETSGKHLLCEKLHVIVWDVQTALSATTIGTATNLTNAATAGDFTATMKTSLNAATIADTSGTTTLLGRLTATRAGYLDNLITGVIPAFPTNFAALLISAGGHISNVDTLTTYTNDVPQSGDSYARLGVAGVGLTNLGDARIANLDAAVSTRSTYAGGDTAGTTTLLVRLSAARGGYLDNLSAGAVALASGVTVTTNNDKAGYALTAGERNSLADNFLVRDWTSTVSAVGQPADRSAMNALRKLRNKIDTISLPGSLSVFREDDITAAYTEVVVTSGAAQLITSCG